MSVDRWQNTGGNSCGAGAFSAGWWCVILAASGIGCHLPPERSAVMHPVDARVLRLEDRLFRQVNEYRHTRGLAALAYDTLLAAEARHHSLRMAERGEDVTHEGFEERLRNLRRLRRTSAVAENVAMNAGYADPVLQAFRDLLASPAHHQTMIGTFTHTGIGVARSSDSAYYFTQLFITLTP